MVVRGEQRSRRYGTALVEVLHDGPRDAQSVERRRAAADLVEQDERALRRVVQDGRRLVHLDQERRLAGGEIV